MQVLLNLIFQSIKYFFNFSRIADHGDKVISTDKPMYIIWAIGRLDENNEPSFHDLYPKSNLKLEFGRAEPDNTCVDFTSSNTKFREPWEKNEIFDRSIRTFRATIGPSGGKRGYQAMTRKSILIFYNTFDN